MAFGPSLLALPFVAFATMGGCSTADDEAAMVPDARAFNPDATGPLPPSDASACRPGDVVTYQPAAYHFATASGLGVCSPAAVQGFYDTCLGSTATAAACASFRANTITATCARCILTPDTETHWGPLIDHGGFISANVAGCIELTDPGGLSCAKSLQALAGCELAACEANCPVEGVISRSAYDDCASTADRGGCHSYDVAASCLADESTSSAAGACLATNFVDFYDAVVPLFCEPPTSLGEAGALVFDSSLDGPPPPRGDASSTDAAGPAADDASSDGRPPGDARGDGPGDARIDARSDAGAGFDAALDATGEGAVPAPEAGYDAPPAADAPPAPPAADASPDALPDGG